MESGNNVRVYSWRFGVRSYEPDAWGMVPAAGILRYFEQAAVEAAADAGYGGEFHEKHGSAWIVRRVTMLMHSPIRHRDQLELTTWISHFAKVRGGREYMIRNALTGQALCTGVTEWVYIDRKTLAPKAIPTVLAVEFPTPGKQLQTYDPPILQLSGRQFTFSQERIVEWHEIDSIGHVNNAIYADWLDDALKATLDNAGWNTGELRENGLHLRGEYYSLNYKRAAMPGDKIIVTTNVIAPADRLCSVAQTINTTEGAELLTANSIYGWLDSRGEPVAPPESWGEP